MMTNQNLLSSMKWRDEGESSTILISAAHIQETAHSLWAEGLRVRPTRGVRSKSSSETPGGGEKRKCCRRVVKKMKSSILAKDSPRQILRPAGGDEAIGWCHRRWGEQQRGHSCIHQPAEKGTKASRFTNFPSLSRKWGGWKLRGLSHSVSSYRADIRRGYTVVPCRRRRNK